MALSNNNPNCLGGQMPMTNESGGHAAAQLGQGVPQGQEMMQPQHPQQQPQTVNLHHQYGHQGHHMGDHYGGYMAPPAGVQPPAAPMAPDHQYQGHNQWYVQQQPPQHNSGMMGPPAAPGPQYQQQYHHQQPYHHMDMNGQNGGWNTVPQPVQHNVAAAVPITVSNPIPDPVISLKDKSKDVDVDSGSRDEVMKKAKKTKKPSVRKVKTAKAGKVKVKKEETKIKKKVVKKVKEVETPLVKKPENSLTSGDENLNEVSAQFSKGCECLDQNCYEGMDPEAVYKHKLNIDELTKLEHDMYLMGITMACLEGTDETLRHKERKRLRSKYRFKGKEVCLGAFLFLEHTTLHHLKSIRKHVRDHGVTPRIHGNHRKRPHNTFPLDIYQRATKFLHAYFEKNSFKEASGAKKKGVISLPSTITCKKIHSGYKVYCQLEEPDGKMMGYSTFRHFIRKQFPNLRFHRDDVAKPIVDG